MFFSVSVAGILDDAAVVEASEATEDDLLVVHSQRYLDTLKVPIVKPYQT